MSELGILLVENSTTDVELIRRALDDAFADESLHVARDGVAALEYLFGSTDVSPADVPERLPKLIILDVKMPRLDGFEVLTRLRANLVTANVPVVMFSSSSSKRDIAEGYRLGASSFVVKPVQFDRLNEVVQLIATYWLTHNRRP